MPFFCETEAPVGLLEINKAETYAGLKFPEEYRQHLLKYNGGRCEPNVFTFVEDGRETSSCMDWCLAIHDGESDSLKDYIDTYQLEEKRLPTHFLPIAHDPGGNLICMSCAGEDEGHIYFWDHETEVDYGIADDPDYTNLYLIAICFDVFLNSLQ